ncbi:hypothetical protein [Thiorhodovibrio frisius]|uniref:Uncharacterized protein n=1 Tax=Thiorhodovibrio frisius TaxID=631362 RepID=H8Z6R1_9GAMM|nr:hypothetical protein [Thiorhodovibrio frisius]EIC20777.1 hypothetical protein Thi970DRAFT_04433 [Thiorhodovibrio frisius]WPL21525.1 hypothetical protein Thiofri_01651 [Thiorhodovibrio frisius]
MDRLLQRQKAIQKALAKRHLRNGHVILYEVSDPADPSRPYCLCRNPQTAQRESHTRERLLDLTTKTLAEIAAYKRATTVEKLGARVGQRCRVRSK